MKTMVEKENMVPAGRLFTTFFRLGMTAFGGPAMVAHMKELAVQKHGWLNDGSFKKGIVLCQSLPGATAIQMAAYIGMSTGGLPGALASYAGFGLPAFLLMLALSIAYQSCRMLPQTASLFGGLQVLVVLLLGQAAWKFGRDGIRSIRDALIPCVCAVLFWIGLNPFLVVIVSALAGLLLHHGKAHPQSQPAKENGGKRGHGVVVLVLAFVAGFALLFVADRELFRLAAVMVKTDFFAFGGGYVALPLMFHEVVTSRSWLDAKTFMDGIALGQITPGPIVITATFVGYLTHGLSGAILASMAIFTPSLLILLLAAPLVDRLHGSRFFDGASRGVLGSFIGLLAAMTMKFGLAVPWGMGRLLLAVGVAILLARKITMLYLVLIVAVVSLALF